MDVGAIEYESRNALQKNITSGSPSEEMHN